MNKYKPLILALVCVLCAAVSFGVVKLVKNSNSNFDGDMVAMGGGSDPSIDESTGSVTHEDKIKENDDNEPNLTEKHESLDAQVKAGDDAEAKAKADAEAKAKADAEKAKADEEAKKAEMSAAQFQGLLTGHDTSILGGQNPKVAKNISFSYQGIKSDDKSPKNDIQAIRDKLEFGQWSSLTVISVTHDAQHKINYAVIQPKYPD